LEEGCLFAKIPIYAGRFYQRVKLLKKKVVISIRPGSYERPQKKEASLAEKWTEEGVEKICLTGEKEEKTAEKGLHGEEEKKIRLLKTVLEKLEEIDLKEAEIIVSGGRGMGTKENYERLCGGLAKVLGAGLGASRFAVNLGWIGREHQIGQTGNIVKPRLYIACGISGAPQHQAGMRDSGYILAINQDEEAEIFDIANLALVGDVNTVVPLLIEEIKKKKADGAF
jgi:electron transfer flavoprotein alpha subunit